MRTILKIGGSLFDHPRLGPGLRHWLDQQPQSESFLMVTGGGALADAIRDLHRTHRLTQDQSHWLALQTLRVSANFLHALVPHAVVVEDAQFSAAHRLAIVDGFAFALRDEQRPRCLEHSWRVTSDALAARMAQVAGADRLILFKSIDAPAHLPAHDWSALGLVDDAFGDALGHIPAQIINFRHWLDESIIP